MLYNFARQHTTPRMSPAVAAGVSDRLSSMEDILALIDEREAMRTGETDGGLGRRSAGCTGSGSRRKARQFSCGEPQAGYAPRMIASGKVTWFKLDKQFGFVELDGGAGDVFLHVSALKAAGYVSLPAGTTLRVRIEEERGRRRIAEVLHVDTSTARLGEAPPVLPKNSTPI